VQWYTTNFIRVGILVLSYQCGCVLALWKIDECIKTFVGETTPEKEVICTFYDNS